MSEVKTKLLTAVAAVRAQGIVVRPSPRMLDLRPRTIAQVREQNRRAALCIVAVVLGLVGYAIACFFQ